jgi:hypothetical protein
MLLTPLVSRRSSSSEVDCQDCGCVLIKDHPVATDAKSEAVTALKGLHVALSRHRLAVKPGFHLLAGISGKSTEILGGAQRQDNRLYVR